MPADIQDIPIEFRLFTAVSGTIGNQKLRLHSWRRRGVPASLLLLIRPAPREMLIERFLEPFDQAAAMKGPTQVFLSLRKDLSYFKKESASLELSGRDRFFTDIDELQQLFFAAKHLTDPRETRGTFAIALKVNRGSLLQYIGLDG